MRPLTRSGTVAKQVLRDIVAVKKGVRGSRLVAILPTIESRFDDLDAAIPPFAGLSARTWTQPAKADLEHCYSATTTPLNLLIADIRQSQPQNLRLWCPYCLIDYPSQIDHYLPRTEFPEYSVHPTNLVPICDRCNVLKSGESTLAPTRRFLQFYLDPIPTSQFLFASVERSGIAPIFEFRLEQQSVPASEYERVHRHFTRLQLLDRYSQVGNQVFNEASSLLATHGGSQSAAAAVTMLEGEIDRWATLFHSRNYWRSVAFQALAIDAAFIASCVGP